MEESLTKHSAVLDCDSVLNTILNSTRVRPLTRVIPFKDVACAIFPPNNKPRAYEYSMTRLRRFIKSDPEICNRLQRAGYRTSLRYLTAPQILILSEYI